jgi:hypothetical protein
MKFINFMLKYMLMFKELEDDVFEVCSEFEVYKHGVNPKLILGEQLNLNGYKIDIEQELDSLTHSGWTFMTVRLSAPFLSDSYKKFSEIRKDPKFEALEWATTGSSKAPESLEKTGWSEKFQLSLLALNQKVLGEIWRASAMEQGFKKAKGQKGIRLLEARNCEQLVSRLKKIGIEPIEPEEIRLLTLDVIDRHLAFFTPELNEI